jgi:hypothetical protein
MISLFPIADRIFAAVDNQVQDFAKMVVCFVELIVMTLFW